MNNINSVYCKILLENGEELQKASLDKKKHLKTLTTENVSDIAFMKSKNHNKLEQIMTRWTQPEVISDICDSTTTNNDIKSMLKSTKTSCEEILSQDWKFTGDFSTYNAQALLSIFLKWVLFGPCASTENDDDKEIESLLNVTPNLFCKTLKQIVKPTTIYNKTAKPLCPRSKRP